MKRVVARFDDEADAVSAETALRDADFDPERPDFENPLSNPAATVPEERGFVWGGVAGGVLGVAVLSATLLNLFVLPRFSPMMSADPLALLAMGLGLGVVAGGFVGGVVGTLRPISVPGDQAVAVTVPDGRADEAESILRAHDAVAVEGRVTYHENPGMWSNQ